MKIPDTAAWIWTQNPQGSKEQYVRFRKRFAVDAKPASATIQISADSRYRLFVNGTTIAFGPSRSYPHQQCVDEHDVTNFLKEGDNLIAVLVYQPGYSHYSYDHQGKSGLLLALEVGGRNGIVSDTSWKSSVDPSFSSDVERISIYAAGQEKRDLRRFEPWTDLDFDAESWEAASVVANLDEPPWLATQTAPLKNLVETIQRPTKIFSSLGRFISNSDPHEEIRSAFSQTSNQTVVSETTELPSVEQGNILLLCYDLGHSQAGSARLLFQGAQGDEKVLVSYLEKKLGDKLVLSDPSTYCQMRMTDQALLASGQNTFEPFTPRGGRFLLIGIVGPSHGGLELEVEFLARRYPISLVKEMKPKEDTLSQIADMCWRTLRSCALDGMVDCPWREQAVWVGDSVITSSIVAKLCGDSQPLKRLLELASQGTNAEGLLPGVVVNVSDSTTVLSYSFAWVEGLSQYLSLTDDIDFISQSWKVLSTMLRRFQSDLHPDGLLRPQPTARHFLDWADLPASEPSCFYNLRYLYALQLAGTLASQLGKTEDASVWKQWASSLAKAIRQTFCQHNQWFDDAEGTSRSQHLAAFLVLTNLISEEDSQPLLQEAIARSLDEPNNPLVLMSPYMHYYLFLALEQSGKGNDLLRIIKYRWKIWLDQGAQTTWENWEVDFPDGSQCHAWSAHPLLFIAKHAGPITTQEKKQGSTDSLRTIGKAKLS